MHSVNLRLDGGLISGVIARQWNYVDFAVAAKAARTLLYCFFF
jgi:hypothetical protein